MRLVTFVVAASISTLFLAQQVHAETAAERPVWEQGEAYWHFVKTSNREAYAVLWDEGTKVLWVGRGSSQRPSIKTEVSAPPRAVDVVLMRNCIGAVERKAMHFIAAVSAVLSMPSLPQLPTAPFVARGLNHVTLNVPDVNKSRDFYLHLLGLTVLQQDKDGCNLSISSTSFLGIYASQEKAGIDHFCIGIDRFDLQATKQKLASMSIKASIEYGNQLYFRDPDGIRVQFSSSDYRG